MVWRSEAPEANGLFLVDDRSSPAVNDLLQNPGAQTMAYNDTHEWFSAEGISITPRDDIFRTNTYPLMQVAAFDKQSGSRIGFVDVVFRF